MSVVRFHLDENVDPDIADGLRIQGIEVTTTPETKLLRTSDSTQFDYVKREGRLLITHDRDFLKIAAKTSDHPGIVFCQMGSRSTGEIILECVIISNSETAEEMRGRVEYI
jgi:predicted nuclease of predicted toxin-antitoxin system